MFIKERTTEDLIASLAYLFNRETKKSKVETNRICKELGKRIGINPELLYKKLTY